ncbi:MAG: glycosyltransferase family 8 protein [Succinivibrionaceae bacterium]
MKKLNLVMCFDSNVIVGILSLMYSIKKNIPNKNFEPIFNLCAIQRDLDNFLELYKKYSDKLNIDSNLIKLHNIEQFDDYKKIKQKLSTFLKKGNRNLTVATFYRLVIFNNLPIEEDRVLYLDTDMICDGSLEAICDIEYGDNILAAVPDFSYQLDYAQKKLNFTGDNYFNAGFLAVNIKNWRSENITEKVLTILIEQMPKQLDQDALNLVCANRVYWLPKKFNRCVNNTNTSCDGDIIIHYTGADKPWKPWCKPSKALSIYRKYLENIETDERVWFDYENIFKTPLSIPSSIHDYKEVARLFRNKKQFFKSFYWWLMHYKLKMKKKGFLSIILGK